MKMENQRANSLSVIIPTHARDKDPFALRSFLMSQDWGKLHKHLPKYEDAAPWWNLFELIYISPGNDPELKEKMGKMIHDITKAAGYSTIKFLELPGCTEAEAVREGIRIAAFPLRSILPFRPIKERRYLDYHLQPPSLSLLVPVSRDVSPERIQENFRNIRKTAETGPVIEFVFLIDEKDKASSRLVRNEILKMDKACNYLHRFKLVLLEGAGDLVLRGMAFCPGRRTEVLDFKKRISMAFLGSFFLSHSLFLVTSDAASALGNLDKTVALLLANASRYRSWEIVMLHLGGADASFEKIEAHIGGWEGKLGGKHNRVRCLRLAPEISANEWSNQISLMAGSERISILDAR